MSLDKLGMNGINYSIGQGFERQHQKFQLLVLFVTKPQFTDTLGLFPSGEIEQRRGCLSGGNQRIAQISFAQVSAKVGLWSGISIGLL